MRRSTGDKVFDAVNIALILLITLVIIYPLYFIVIASISDPYEVALGKVSFVPVGVTLDAYANVFRNNDIWTGYRNTIIYTVLGTIYNLVLTIPAAYVLSKRYLPMRTGLSWYFFITMYFSGGLIPTYMLMRSLNLIDNPLALILGPGVSCYNMIVTRQFFSSTIPDELYEASAIDGASEFVTFLRVAVPLSMPILAVMALFYGVGHWNSYYNALIYINSRKYFPLQTVLRNILILNQNALLNIETSGIASDADAVQHAARLAYMANAMKYALIIVSSLPLLCAYPFVQKHFVKGIMMGSLKG